MGADARPKNLIHLRRGPVSCGALLSRVAPSSGAGYLLMLVFFLLAFG